MPKLEKSVTCDDLMEEFISDSIVSDDELSESIFTCVDNYIDDLCVDVMQNENSLFETDNNSSDTPFTYILDKVMERVDTIEDIQSDSYAKSLEKQLGINGDDEEHNYSDPDYCEGVDFDEVTPEDFQLYIPNANTDDESVDDEDGYCYRTNNPGLFDDSNFNDN